MKRQKHTGSQGEDHDPATIGRNPVAPVHPSLRSCVCKSDDAHGGLLGTLITLRDNDAMSPSARDAETRLYATIHFIAGQALGNRLSEGQWSEAACAALDRTMGTLRSPAGILACCDYLRDKPSLRDSRVGNDSAYRAAHGDAISVACSKLAAYLRAQIKRASAADPKLVFTCDDELWDAAAALRSARREGSPAPPAEKVLARLFDEALRRTTPGGRRGVAQRHSDLLGVASEDTTVGAIVADRVRASDPAFDNAVTAACAGASASLHQVAHDVAATLCLVGPGVSEWLADVDVAMERRDPDAFRRCTSVAEDTYVAPACALLEKAQHLLTALAALAAPQDVEQQLDIAVVRRPAAALRRQAQRCEIRWMGDGGDALPWLVELRDALNAQRWPERPRLDAVIARVEELLGAWGRLLGSLSAAGAALASIRQHPAYTRERNAVDQRQRRARLLLTEAAHELSDADEWTGDLGDEPNVSEEKSERIFEVA